MLAAIAGVGYLAYKQSNVSKQQFQNQQNNQNKNQQIDNNNALLIGEWDGLSTPVANTKYFFDANGQVTYLYSDGTKNIGSWKVIHDLTAEHVNFPKTTSGELLFSEDTIKSFNNKYLKIQFGNDTEYYGFVFSENNHTLELANITQGDIMWYTNKYIGY